MMGVMPPPSNVIPFPRHEVSPNHPSLEDPIVGHVAALVHEYGFAAVMEELELHRDTEGEVISVVNAAGETIFNTWICGEQKEGE